MDVGEFGPRCQQVIESSKASTAMCMGARHAQVPPGLRHGRTGRSSGPRAAELEETMQKLAEAQAKLKAVMDKLERLEKEFNEANDKKMQLQRDVEECAARLERAKKLIGGLGGERTRWTESCATLELSYAKLVGDALISAATIAIRALHPTFRKGMTDHWQTR